MMDLSLDSSCPRIQRVDRVRARAHGDEAYSTVIGVAFHVMS